MARTARASAKPEPMVRVTEVSDFLGVPEKTLANWRSGGTGPTYYKYGKHVYYRMSDVVTWLEEQKNDRMAAAGR